MEDLYSGGQGDAVFLTHFSVSSLRKRALNCHGMKAVVFSVLGEIEEETGGPLSRPVLGGPRSWLGPGVNGGRPAHALSLWQRWLPAGLSEPCFLT